MTHKKLVIIAAKYLEKKHPIVITEMKTWAVEIPDAIGFKIEKEVETTVIECKTSRQDFVNDMKKNYRKNADIGMGSHRYYLIPRGLLSANEIPDKWGLLEVYGRSQRVRTVKPATKIERNYNAEQILLISALRRIGKHMKPGDGMSINYYTIRTHNTATLGIENE